jgi:dTDP-4-dehydrorhamnose reductase
MKYVIFGSNGLVGTSFRNITDVSDDFLLHRSSDFDASNILFLENYLNIHNPDVVINCIGISNIKICENDINGSLTKQFNIPCMIANWCHKNEKIFAHISSHGIFDGLKDNAYNEFDIPKPLNINALTKVLAEKYINNKCDRYYVFRLPMLYGPRRNNEVGFFEKLFIWLKTKNNIDVSYDKTDTPTYSLDAAELIIAIIKNNRDYGTYHISSSTFINFYEMVLYIANLTSSKTIINKCLEEKFNSTIPKPLNSGLESVKCNSVRSFNDSISYYIENIVNE